jgi:hypothetical protein
VATSGVWIGFGSGVYMRTWLEPQRILGGRWCGSCVTGLRSIGFWSTGIGWVGVSGGGFRREVRGMDGFIIGCIMEFEGQQGANVGILRF